MSGPATPPANPPDPLTFEVTVTLDDQLALEMRCLATPAMQAGRLRRLAVTVLVAAACAPLGLVGGLLIGWSRDRTAPPIGTLFRTLLLDGPGPLGGAVLVMVCCTLGGVGVQRWLLRPRMRRVLRRIIRARPDVDPSDPQLAYRARVSVGDEGLESRTGTGTTLVRWDVLHRWEETGDHLLVLGNGMVGFCLRASAVDPASLNRFRAILGERLGPKSAPRGRRVP